MYRYYLIYPLTYDIEFYKTLDQKFWDDVIQQHNTVMTYISSNECRMNSIIFINLRKKLKKFLLYFKGVPTFSQSRAKNQ